MRIRVREARSGPRFPAVRRLLLQGIGGDDLLGTADRGFGDGGEAGREQFPHLNETMDRFLAAALGRNLPVTFVDHPEGPHAFDLEHDSARTREIVRQTLAFLRAHLGEDLRE